MAEAGDGEAWRSLPPMSDGGEGDGDGDGGRLDADWLDLETGGRKGVVLLVLGSFNPPHEWHARLPGVVAEALKRPSERFPNGAHVVGAFLSPVHDGYGKPGLEKAEHRIAMARIAVADKPGVAVDTWEATRPQHQRSLAVASSLHRRVGRVARAHGAAEAPAVVIACGSDLVKSMATPGHWRPEDVEALTGAAHGVVAVLRAGAETVDAALSQAARCPWLASAVRTGGLRFVDSGEASSASVSSTVVRALLATGGDTAGVLPPGVRAYVDANRLYRRPA